MEEEKAEERADDDGGERVLGVGPCVLSQHETDRLFFSSLFLLLLSARGKWSADLMARMMMHVMTVIM